jgi:hypothetical protein
MPAVCRACAYRSLGVREYFPTKKDCRRISAPDFLTASPATGGFPSSLARMLHFSFRVLKTKKSF